MVNRSYERGLDLAERSGITAGKWEQLDEQARIAALEMLAKLIAQAAQNELPGEGNNHD